MPGLEKKIRYFPLLISMLLSASFFIVLAGCTPRTPGKLSVGMMPAVNSIPLFVAEKNGYFADEKVEVELVLFKSQFYRESALQSGQIDGSVSDLINAINEWQNGMDVKVTSTTDGLFALLSSPASGIRSIEDWTNSGRAKLKTGLLENSIVYYVTERMLADGGGDAGKIDLISTLHMPSRLEMLIAGELDAACLPEPMTRIALAQGAHLVADTNAMSSTPGVLLFTGKALTEKKKEIAAFYRAYNRAVKDLEKNADAYRPLVVEKGEFPPAVEKTMQFPVFTAAVVPSEADFADVSGWMREKGLLKKNPRYEDIVTSDFAAENVK